MYCLFPSSFPNIMSIPFNDATLPLLKSIVNAFTSAFIIADNCLEANISVLAKFLLQIVKLILPSQLFIILGNSILGIAPYSSKFVSLELDIITSLNVIVV